MRQRIPEDAGARSGLRWHRALLALCVLCAAAAMLSWAYQPAAARAAGKGLIDNRLIDTSVDSATVDAAVAEMTGVLRARWTLITVNWALAQPSEPPAAYRETYLANLDSIVAALHAAGVRTILMPLCVPQWASDPTLWNSPPPGYSPGYNPIYLPAAEHVADFGTFGAELARRYSKYGVMYQCWNEANLAWFLYPQHSAADPDLGVSMYLKMLKSFSNGIKGVEPNATVIAGGTAPWGAIVPGSAGYNESTSPQYWAEYLRDNGGAAYFDGYAHHPYDVSGNAPEVKPWDTATTVTLANLGQLLKVFPKKPFYLTEYGYATVQTAGGLPPVTEAQQALYLRQAWAMVAKHRQVKTMLWYPLRDEGNWTTGLETSEGIHKAAYYAFSGRNSVTLAAPASVQAAEAFAVSGVLRGREGVLAGKQVQLETRLPWQISWTTLRSTSTRSDGAYTFSSVKQAQSSYYRVRWSGVCESVKGLVLTK